MLFDLVVFIQSLYSYLVYDLLLFVLSILFSCNEIAGYRFAFSLISELPFSCLLFEN